MLIQANTRKNWIVASFLEACTETIFCEKWVTANDFCSAISTLYKLNPESSFTGNELKKALSCKTNAYLAAEMDQPYDIVTRNHIGIFRQSYRPRGKTRTLCFFCVLNKGDVPPTPPSGKKWFDNITSLQYLHYSIETRNKTLYFKTESNYTYEISDVININKSYDEKAPKRQKINPPKQQSTQQSETPIVDYWQSKNASNLFRPTPNETDALVAINAQIEILLRANESPTSIYSVLTCKHTNQSLCEDDSWDLTVHQTWSIRQKMSIILASLNIAKEKMETVQNWDECCSEALSSMKKLGVVTKITNARTVRNWYCEFREMRKFPIIKYGQKNLPPFLAQNDDIKQRIVQYGREQLSELTCEFLLEYIHDSILPVMVEEQKDEEEIKECKCIEDKKKVILKQYGLTCICPQTIYNWMKLLGFKYGTRKKGYYVDGHERPATVAYRYNFVSRYLSRERQMHRWIQIPLARSIELEENKDVPIGSGHSYSCSRTGNKMVEYHVDSCSKFHEEMNKESIYGGNLSVRKKVDEKPLVIFGHDECIFKQYALTSKSWAAPDGTTALVPKDDGQGVMVSAFQSREFGFGFRKLTTTEVEKINAEKRHNCEYIDKTAAVSKRGSANKKPFTINCNPFCVEFEYGANKEGYWCYEHMILQFEDCVDIITCLYPQFQFLFLFDHSCGHDRQREDALNAEVMSKGFGGKQRHMHTSVMKDLTFFGPHSRILKLGDTQHMVYQDSDTGPFYLSSQEKKKQKYDQAVPGKFIQRNKTKVELVKELTIKNINCTVGTVFEKVKKMCTDNNVDLKCAPEPKVIEGWHLKPKGYLQILWERGFISEKDLSKYTVNGKKDSYGFVDKSFSLKQIMANTTDFQNEESLLQSKGRELGVLVDRSPKCHCEIAGEGIEYSWGFSKNRYRRLPLKNKRKKDEFRNLVRDCLSRDMITTTIVRKFSKRARDYICSYQILRTQKKDESTNLTLVRIEALHKDFKTHRSALDFDTAFIETEVVRSVEREAALVS